MDIQPPKRILNFLRWFCREDYLEEIEGDLTELFEKRHETSNIKAKRRFFWDVIKTLRLRNMKTFRGYGNSNHLALFQHTLLLAFRNFRKYKSSFLINLTSLSTGLTCVILIYLWINDELSIDKFHEKDNRLYQVMQNLELSNGIRTMAMTPFKLASALAEEIPEVEFATSEIPVGFFNDHGILSVDKKHIKAAEKYAGQDYFKIFSTKLLEGDKSNVLALKNSVVISDELALKLFSSTENVVGKYLKWTKEDLIDDFIVTGIFKKPPKASTSQFDLILNIQVLLDQEPYMKEWWNNDPRTYIVLTEGADLIDVNQKIKNFFHTKVERSNSTLFLQKYSDRYLWAEYRNGKIVGGRVHHVRLFSVVALMILAIACFNFINLSTAQASRRSKEIGIKKTIGASRKALITQHLSESMLMVGLSLITAGLMAFFLLPTFNAILEKDLTIQLDYELLIGVFGLVVATGLMSGVYPAFYLTKFNSISMLKNSLNAKSDKTLFRHGLIILQFCVSILLIISVIVIYKQTGHIQSKDLGYDREHVISINNDGALNDNLESFLDRLKNIPGVVNATTFSHDLVGDYGGTTGVSWEGKNPEELIRFGNLEVGYDFAETLSIEIVEGRSYSREFPADESRIVFNEAAITAMGLENPIGKTIGLWGSERQIIGVVENFHFESLYEGVKPCFLFPSPLSNKTLIKIQPGTEFITIGQIESLFHEFNEGFPFEYKNLNDDYQDMYVSEKQVAVLSRYFCVIAIVISCLGLFGLVALTTERRIKEIGVRKILGSTVLSIITMLASNFTKMVVIAIVVALPLGYLISQEWLNTFAYHIELEWWFFALAGVTALLIAWLTVGFQTYKAASVNPVECLRYE